MTYSNWKKFLEQAHCRFPLFSECDVFRCKHAHIGSSKGTSNAQKGVGIYIMMTSSNRNTGRVTGHLCGEFTGPGEFPTQRPVTRNCDVFFDLRPNKLLNKQSWGWWFETPSRPLWRHRNANFTYILVLCEFTLQLCGFYGASHFCGDPALRMACHGPMVEKG